jgi:hypothetical protein
MPGDRVEFLYHASQGENLSGRSTNIQSAFASASADQTLNGGVGVTSFIGGNPSNQDPTAVQHLTAQAEWARHFSFTGATSEVAFMEVVVPALEVGLIGVPSEATSISNTETAEADAKFDLTIEHNDGTENVGTIFEFGLRVFEKQVVSGPQLFNVVDRTLLGINDETQHLFKLHDNGVPSNPRFFLDPVDYQFALPVLQPGDEVFFDYSLTAEGTTKGGEQGFVAFLGDPFSLDAKPDNLVISLAPTTAVPEPATWVLTILGFGAVARFATRRRILARPEISPAPAK